MPKRRSVLLVFLQLTSIFVILFTGPLFAKTSILLLTEIVGIGVGIWALIIMFSKSKFNPFPEIKKGAKLTTSGPYQYIRHPMYLSVILITTPLVLDYPNPLRTTTLVFLIAIHIYKLEYEEKMLLKNFKSYKNYAYGTKKLIPFVY